MKHNKSLLGVLVNRAKGKLHSRETRALLIMVLLLIPAFLLLIVMSTYGTVVKENERTANVLESIAEVAASDLDSAKTAVNTYDTFESSNLQLMKSIVSSLVTEEGYVGPRILDDGIVCDVRDGQLIFPDGTPEEIRALTVEDINFVIGTGATKRINIKKGSLSFDTNEYAAQEDVSGVDVTECLVYGTYINDDLAYIDITPEDDLWSTIDSKDYTTKLVQAAEGIHGGAIFIVDETREGMPLLFPSGVYPDVNSAAELGITFDDLKEGTSLVLIQGIPHILTSKYLQNYGCYATFAYPLSNLVAHIVSRTLFVVSVMGIIIATLVTYLFSAKRHARSGKLTEDELEGLHPYTLRNHAIAIGLVGVLVVAFVTFFVHMLGVIQVESVTTDSSLASTFESLEADKKSKREAVVTDGQQWYTYYGLRMADMLSRYPELATKENLQKYSDALGADYIMLFDASGDETLCNKDYVGFSLGLGQGEESGDFRRLLKGVRSIAHGVSTDEVTGTEAYYIGVTVPTSDENANGALVMAIPPRRIFDASSEPKTDTQLSIIATKDQLLFSADKETQTILNSSRKNMVGANIKDCGLNEMSLSNEFMDFARILGISYFVATSATDTTVYYYAVQVQSLLSDSTARVLCAIACFLIVFVIIARYSLKGYTVEEFERIVPAEEREDAEATAYSRKHRHANERGIRGLVKTIVDPNRSLLGLKDMGPIERARFVLAALLCVVVLVVYYNELEGFSFLHDDGNHLLDFILNGNWLRGPNVFALTSIIILCSGALVLVIACRFVLRILSNFLESKGKTIVRLLSNFIGYLTLAVVIYNSLNYLGIPAGTILGSLGLSGLALTFGAREIIADILSGISIIFEGDFQVGDIVEIDGFRGVVKEISVRATHVLNADGNYKIIRNMDIRKVTNMSKRHSRFTLNILIPRGESLAEVEEKLVRGLATIERHPKVISGPTYVGVTSIGPTDMTLKIEAECIERDMDAVSLYLNREIFLMLEREGVNVK